VFALPWVEFALRLLVASIFICYGINKMWSIPQFTVVIQRHCILPRPLASPVAMTISALKMVLGSLLLFNVVPLYVSLAMGMLIIAFSLLLVRAQLNSHLNIHD
jgi:uncharacterized membrane protein YphA (DoxX/SURF4 family)